MSIELKEKIIELINAENIPIEYSYAASFKQNGFIESAIDSNHNFFSLKIVVPKLIDSELELSIILAHELGHHNVYKKMPKLLRKIVMKNAIPHLVYLNEWLAWKEARKIAYSISCWDPKDAYKFEEVRKSSIRTYKPKSLIKSALNTLIGLIKLWFFIYFIISFTYLALLHNIPVPFLNEPFEINFERKDYFSTVNNLLISMISLYVFIKAIIKFTIFIKRK